MSVREAWGILVPVFEKIGLLCVSAADSRDQLMLK